MKIAILYNDVPGGRKPTKGHPTDAGWDLYCSERTVLVPGQTVTIPTGLSVGIPDGWYGQIQDRSSLGSRGLAVLAGTIDPGYRGPVNVVMFNGSGKEHVFERHDRVAQFVYHKVEDVEWVFCDELPPSPRGSGGFGSTGR